VDGVLGRSKHQIPSTKSQGNSKTQIPTSKTDGNYIIGDCPAVLDFGPSDFGLPWDLVLGI
jgi:hypothetical protein